MTHTRRLVTNVVVAVGLLSLPAVARAATPRLDDQSIRYAVEEELFVDSAVPYLMIDVETDSGVVTLTGKVDNILAKERATRIAQMVKGVRSVVNRIEVKPSRKVADADIRREAEAALRSDPATESYEVRVRVEDGVVTTEGQVQSHQEKELVATVVKGVRGVRDLSNLVRVNYDTDRPDAELKAEIEQALRWDVLVDDGLIDVAVNDGQVTLTGTVGSAAEKTEAFFDSWVAGVKGVDTSKLEVARWARDEDLRGKKYAVRTETEIAQAVRDALLYDPRVASFNVTPEVSGRIVTLRGTVDNVKAERAAVEDAANTVGVLGVRDRLKVRPEKLVANDELAKRVRRALSRDPYVDRLEIGVRSESGIVTLTGVVDSGFERARADDVASRIAGVAAVVNHLDVKDARPQVYDPYLDDFDYYAWNDYEPWHTFRSDFQIEREIRDQLWWSPFVDADEVKVDVDGGVATLTGKVDSQAERRAATTNAFEAGATWVENELEVGTAKAG